MTSPDTAATQAKNVQSVGSYLRGQLKQRSVWIPLTLGVVAILAVALPVNLPNTFFIALGAALVVLGLLQLLTRTSDPDTPGPRHLSVGVAAAAAGTGITLVIIWLGTDVEGLGLIGAIVVYVAVGHLLLTVRRRTMRMRWLVIPGLGILAVCAAAFLISWELLVPGENKPPKLPVLALALLVGSVLVAPVGLSLLSEGLLRRLGKTDDGPGSARKSRVILAFALLGPALLVAATVRIAVRSEEIYTPLVAAGIGLFLLIGLITGRTQADTIVITFALIALAAVAPHEDPGPDDPGDGPVIVALGDSYMSGEGADSFFEDTDVSGKNECRRAESAFPFLYAADGGASDYPGGVVSYACSGARIANLIKQADAGGEPPRKGGKPQHGQYEPIGGGPPGMTQYEQLAQLLEELGGDVGLILLSIGGNDSGFATIGLTCVAPGDCSDQEDLWLGNLAHVRSGLRDAYAALHSTLAEYDADVPVVVVPYPDPLNEKTCSDVALSQSEVDFIHTFLRQLNRRVQLEAEAAGFRFLGPMRKTFDEEDLRLCDDGDKTGVNFLSAQSMNGSVEAQVNPKNWVHNSLHPNEDGHQAMENSLAAWLDARKLRPQEHDPEEVEGEYLEVEPQCSMTQETGTQGTGLQCDDEARKWALGQTKDWLEDAYLVTAAFLAGAWLSWLVVLAHVRRRGGFVNWLRGMSGTLKRWVRPPAHVDGRRRRQHPST